ncbi:MAG: hypothetical protein K0R84_2096 [Clostridia bacterium]|jgi:hypothetical protein|nr:hypothetical protein [Clostridia bacterium]
MSYRRKKKVMGMTALAVGIGILLVLIIPVVGWIAFSAICLICCGIYLLRF